jgi:DNA-binding beta-propeller fold protein YncE
MQVNKLLSMKTSTLTHFLTNSLLFLFLVACNDKETVLEKTWSNSDNISAGDGTSGFADGSLSSAQFKNPKGVAVDASGNVFVADMSNNRIRKISADGKVTTIAGNGRAGFADGKDTAAMFFNPVDVALDGSGNIFLVDLTNQRIRKITPDGTVATVAGRGGSIGYSDGPAATAAFNRPRGLALDGAGNIYVADMDNNRIRKVSINGTVSTLAGSGTEGFADGIGTVAQFKHPRDLVVDAAGNVYVADAENNRIRKITPSGVVTTFAGSGIAGFAEGIGTAAIFNGPKGIAIDSQGNLYIGDSENNRIRKITPDGTVSTVAGNGTAGFKEASGIEAEFNKPRGITLSADGKYAYVADEGNNRIRKVALK